MGMESEYEIVYSVVEAVSVSTNVKKANVKNAMGAAYASTIEGGAGVTSAAAEASASTSVKNTFV